MATNIVQMKDGSGNNQYPVTSAEAVGMPDGSGNLQTYLNKRVTELNISVLYPTNGEGGTNKYTLAGAIAQVPQEYRTIIGLKITFINNDTSKPQSWEYNGGTFTTTSNWVQGDGSGGNLILEWDTDVATTRKQVLSQERKAGMQISYKNNAGNWVNEQYIGTYLYDSEWIKDSNWLTIADKIQLDAVQVITENSINDLKNGVDIQFENINVGQITDGQMILNGVVKQYTGRATSDFINVEKYQGETLMLCYCGGFSDSQTYAFYDK